MDNITSFVFMLYGFAKFNEIQPNIKQWNKIRMELNLIDMSISPQFQELITVINNVEQVPTSAQWREIKIIAEKMINQLKMKVDLNELYPFLINDDIGCYETEDNFLSEAYYDYEQRNIVSPTKIKIDPTIYSINTFTPVTTSVINDSSSISHDEIRVIDDFIANSYK